MFERERTGHSLPAHDRTAAQGACEEDINIGSVFRVPERYLRSIHLGYDFDDPESLSQYVITPPLVASFSRIIEPLQLGSANRAWRVTGDYGTGKSSFALVLAHLLWDPASLPVGHIRHAIERWSAREISSENRILPVLVTGSREPLVPAVARSLKRSLRRLGRRRADSEIIRELESRSAAVVESADPSQLLDLIDQFCCCAGKLEHSGVLLVLDELGKFLEYAALRSDTEDVYVLQRLAEAADRSDERPLMLLGLLHQGFHAYAENLPSTHRQEWQKVAGRFGEITFDQPLSHVTAVVKEALNVDPTLITSDVELSLPAVQAAAVRTGWYGTSGEVLSPLDTYPLHPTVLPVLVRFFGRFGQHERSLLSFLLSSEPFGLQHFAQRRASGRSWYRLSDFYDYIRSAFGHRLAGKSHQNHWLRISDTIDRMTDLTDFQLEVLKTVAVLNVLDAEHLLANDVVLAAGVGDEDGTGAISEAIAALRHRKLIFNRGIAGGYCLWPSTSVDLESTFEEAKRVLGPVTSVSAQLKPHLTQNSIVGRRHYIESGTLRYFEIRYADITDMLETMERPVEADGLVVMVLSDTPEGRQAVIANVEANSDAMPPDVLVAVPLPLQPIAAEVLDAESWQWVGDNTPELSQDPYASAEVARQIAASQKSLKKILDSVFGFHDGNFGQTLWWHRGRAVTPPEKGKLSAMVSEICDELYGNAPRILNELLNRRTLSSAASAARQRLVERMFSDPSEPSLGFDDGKAPPEKSMYLSVLAAGNVHREANGQLILLEPPPEADPLNLRPALSKIVVQLEQANGRRVSVAEIFKVLQNRPYGVRMGVAPLVLAITLVAHAHEIAVYENGTYLQTFGSSDFLRLTKQPSTFDLQLCRVTGLRMEVFNLLVRIFAEERSDGRGNELLDVVRPLSVFAAQLPEYTRLKTNLPDSAKSVRDALLTAREPATLVFEGLPIACGNAPFALDGPTDSESARRFVDALRHTLDQLRATYPELLDRLRQRITLGLADGSADPSRDLIVQRASRLARVATEPRMQSFARCLADSALGDDAWTERAASFVVSKPPARWTSADEIRAMNEIDILTAAFRRVEATVFDGHDDEPCVNALRLGLTRGDGSEVATVIRIRAKDEAKVRELATGVERVLADANGFELAAISRALWNILGDTDRVDGLYPSAEPRTGCDSAGGL